MTTRISQSSDRHRAGSVQMKVWLSAELKNDFASVCALQRVCASTVLRGLVSAYVARSSGTTNG